LLKTNNQSNLQKLHLHFENILYCVYLSVGGNGIKTEGDPKNIKLAE
jgi:hypothetical protein